MGHAAVVSLPDLSAADRHLAKCNIFARNLRSFTILATIAYCFHIFTYYYILKWLPTIVVDMGFPAASAAGVLVWTNVGGVTGAVLFGLLAKRAGLKRLTILLMVTSSVMVIAFGRASKDLGQLSLICAAAGFSITAAVVGLYGIFARGFPTNARASGTGFGIGIGRGGSVIAPIVAGVLFRSGYGLAEVSAAMAIGSLVAAAALLAMSFPGDRSKTSA
jgi:predicted MFS family arabinose efflux permease